MKKLGKLTLGELREESFVSLDNELQKQIVGGYVFYDRNGSRIGQIGSSYEVRLCSQDDYNSALTSGISGNKLGQSLSSASDSTKESFYGGLARSMGLNFGSIQIDSLGSEIGYQYDGCKENNNATLTVNRQNGYNYSERELISMLGHEVTHGNQSCIENSDEREFDAYYAQVTSPDFNNCSRDYKDGILASMAKFANNCAKDNQGDCYNQYTDISSIKSKLGIHY